MIHQFRLFLISCLLVGSTALHAQEALVLEPGVGHYPLGPYIAILEDPSRELTIEDVASAEYADRFESVNDPVPNFGYTRSVYWVRLRVARSEFAERTWLLECANPLMDSIILYQQDPNGGWVYREIGDTIPFDVREIRHRHPMFRLLFEQELSEPKILYLRLENQSSLAFPLNLWLPLEFAQRASEEQYVLGLYYGILIAMTILNLFFYLSSGDRNYLLYVVYLVAFVLTALVLNGLAFQYFWPTHPKWANFTLLFIVGMVPMPMLLFSRSFLLTQLHTPVLDRFLLILFGASLVFVVFSFLLPFHLGAQVVSGLSFVSGMLIIFVGALIAYRGFRPARYFVIAWLGLLLGGMVYALKAFGVLPATFLTTYSFQIGSAAEVLLLTLALMDRFQVMRDEKDAAQQAVLTERNTMLTAASRFVPEPFLKHLGRESIVEAQLGDQVERELTILFSDIRDFTSISEGMSPEENFNFINSLLRRFGPVIREHNGFIDKYLGDAVMALFPGRPEDALAAGARMQEMLRGFNEEGARAGLPPIQIGIGVNTGKAMLGTIGEAERMETTVISDAVNLASRLEGLTKTYGASMIMSEQTFQRLSDHADWKFRVLDRVQVKGKRDPVSVFEVLDGYPEELVELRVKTKSDFERGISAYQSREFNTAAEYFRAVLVAEPDDAAATLYLRRCEYLTEHGVPPDWEGIWKMDRK